MQLLTSQSLWRQWVKGEIGSFTTVLPAGPKTYPCYAYAQLESWGQETLRPVYLYRSNLEAMALELLAADGTR